MEATGDADVCTSREKRPIEDVARTKAPKEMKDVAALNRFGETFGALCQRLGKVGSPDPGMSTVSDEGPSAIQSRPFEYDLVVEFHLAARRPECVCQGHLLEDRSGDLE